MLKFNEPYRSSEVFINLLLVNNRYFFESKILTPEHHIFAYPLPGPFRMRIRNGPGFFEQFFFFFVHFILNFNESLRY